MGETITTCVITLHYHLRFCFGSEFQFLWMGETETANSITMSFLSPPALLVLEVDTQHYYLPPFHPQNVSLQAFTDFLDGVRDGTIPVSSLLLGYSLSQQLT